MPLVILAAGAVVVGIALGFPAAWAHFLGFHRPTGDPELPRAGPPGKRGVPRRRGTSSALEWSSWGSRSWWRFSAGPSPAPLPATPTLAAARRAPRPGPALHRLRLTNKY